MGNGEWKLRWRPEDFESPICFVWLTKQRRNIYAVAESRFAVNCPDKLSGPAPPAPWEDRLPCLHLPAWDACHRGNGQWKSGLDGEWN